MNSKRLHVSFLGRVVILSLSIILCVASAVYARSEYWNQRVSLFSTLPIDNDDIVFLGNSITDGGEFCEIFNNANIKNRGISGDVISGVRERLMQVVSGHPAKIFLLIGINDISHNKTAVQLAEEYEALVKEIRTQSPSTELFIQSVMPINNDFKRYKNLFGKEDVVKELNIHLKNIADNNGAEFIDLFPLLSEKDSDKLQKEYTNDGLHLLGSGYKVWAEALTPYIKKNKPSSNIPTNP